MTALSTKQLALVDQDVAFLCQETKLGYIEETFRGWIKYLSGYCGLNAETGFEDLCEKIQETLQFAIHTLNRQGRGIPVLCKIIEKQSLTSTAYRGCSPTAVFDAYLAAIKKAIQPLSAEDFDKKMAISQACSVIIFTNEVHIETQEESIKDNIEKIAKKRKEIEKLEKANEVYQKDIEEHERKIKRQKQTREDIW